MKTTALLATRAGRMISACVACLALAHSAVADVIVTRAYDTPKAVGATVTFSDVLETATNPPDVTLVGGPTPPATWLYPPNPITTSDNKLSFGPINYATTVSNEAYSQKNAIDAVVLNITPDAGVGPLTLDVLLRGEWSFMPNQLAAFVNSSSSLAAFGATASVDLAITGLNGQSVMYTGESYPLVNFSTGIVSGTTNQSGVWQGRLTMSWDDIKAALLPTNLMTQQITQLQVSIGADIFSASQYAQATTRVEELTITAQPVPEPPTIILAGLGAVAVVANGYRRKKQRRESSLLLEQMEDTGAIALTA